MKPYWDWTKLLLTGCNFEFTATGCSNGGTAIHIKKGLNFKPRKDLDICKSKQLESTFTEINLKNEEKKSNRLHIQTPFHEASRIQYRLRYKPLGYTFFRKQDCSLLGDFNADLDMTKIATFPISLIWCTLPFSFHIFSAQLALNIISNSHRPWTIYSPITVIFLLFVEIFLAHCQTIMLSFWS